MIGFLTWTGHPWLALPVRFYLAWVFIFASVHKIADPGMFAIDVATYEILPLSLVNLMAITLPWIEFAAGIMLAIGFCARGAALAVFGMMVMFLVAIVIALLRGLDMSCGCFASQGAAADPISWLTVARDLVWLVLAGYVVIFDREPIGLDRWRVRRAHA